MNLSGRHNNIRLFLLTWWGPYFSNHLRTNHYNSTSFLQLCCYSLVEVCYLKDYLKRMLFFLMYCQWLSYWNEKSDFFYLWFCNWIKKQNKKTLNFARSNIYIRPIENESASFRISKRELIFVTNFLRSCVLKKSGFQKHWSDWCPVLLQ